jgi:hypothetical protein
LVPDIRARDLDVDSPGDRLRLRQLDGCLAVLEEAHERGEHAVEPDVLDSIRPFVPGVRPGMPITKALDQVFKAQASYMRFGDTRTRSLGGRAGGTVARGEALVPAGWEHPLSDVAARQLTERIRSAARRTCLLLLEAHQRRAWLALGYRSWEQYVRREFDMSRRRSYELLDQGRVVQAIQLAARLREPPAISAYAALQIKAQLPAVTEAVRQCAAGLPRRRAMMVIDDIVQKARRRAIARPARPADSSVLPLKAVERSTPGDRAWAHDTPAQELHRFLHAVELLSRMPPVGIIVAAIPDASSAQLANLDLALDWLLEFADRWNARRSRPR